MSAETDAGDLAARLHEELSAVTARPDLFDRVAARARHRTRIRAAAAVLAAAALTTVVSVSVSDLTASPGTTAVSGAGTGTGPGFACPATLASAVPTASGRTGVAGDLVPPTPVSALVCDYTAGHPVSGLLSPATLGRQRDLVGAQLSTVVAAMQAPVRSYAFSCPAGSIPKVEAVFRYAQGPNVAVIVAGGCPSISNGTLTGAFNQEGTLPSSIASL